jgi:hypothetical protein
MHARTCKSGCQLTCSRLDNWECTYYLGTDLEVQLSAALARELLWSAQLEEREGYFDEGLPVAVSIPGFKDDGLHIG